MALQTYYVIMLLYLIFFVIDMYPLSVLEITSHLRLPTIGVRMSVQSSDLPVGVRMAGQSSDLPVKLSATPSREESGGSRVLLCLCSHSTTRFKLT